VLVIVPGFQLIVPFADNEPDYRVDGHGEGVHQGDLRVGHDGIGFQVVTDDGEIQEAEGGDEGENAVKPEGARDLVRLGLFNDRGFKLFRIFHQEKSREQHHHQYHEREPHQAVPVLVVDDRFFARADAHEEEGEDQRPDGCADLVEKFYNGKAETRSYLLGGLRKDRVLGRAAYPFADPLEHHEDGRELPDAGERQHRDDHQETVAEDGEEPVRPGFIGEVAARQPDQVAQQLAEAGHQPYNGRAGPQCFQVRAIDSPRAFVDDIAQQADQAEEEDEAESGGFKIFQIF